MPGFLNIDEDKVVKCYFKKKSSIAIASWFNVSPGKIQSVLKKKNITLGFNKKYTVDECYFKKINTHEKAYFLGFLFADGCVRKVRKSNPRLKSYELKLKIHKKDIEILRQFKRALKSTASIKKEKGTNCNAICVYNKNIVNDLINLGCVQTKSLVLEFPKQIPKKYWRSFILGYFDGDGCIYINKNGYATCSFVGTDSFLSVLNLYLASRLDIPLKKIQHTQGKACALAITGSNNLVRLRKFLYKCSPVYLTRKKKIFNKIIYQTKHEINKNISTSLKKHTFLQYKKNKTLIKKWESMYDILKNHKKWCKARIYECCTGEKEDAYGFIWEYGKINA